MGHGLFPRPFWPLVVPTHYANILPPGFLHPYPQLSPVPTVSPKTKGCGFSEINSPTKGLRKGLTTGSSFASFGSTSDLTELGRRKVLPHATKLPPPPSIPPSPNIAVDPMLLLPYSLLLLPPPK